MQSNEFIHHLLNILGYLFDELFCVAGSDISVVPEEHVLSDAVLPPVCDPGTGPGLPPPPPPSPGPSTPAVAPHLRHPPPQPQHARECCGLQDYEQCHGQIS